VSDAIALPDDGIPVLTEVVDAMPAPAVPGPGVATPDAAALDAMAARIEARVLAGLGARIEPLMAQGMREALTGAIERIITQAGTELADPMWELLRQAVTPAVAEEIAALRRGDDAAQARD
jgi:hypothetical protein